MSPKIDFEISKALDTMNMDEVYIAQENEIFSLRNEIKQLKRENMVLKTLGHKTTFLLVVSSLLISISIHLFTLL